MNTISIDQLVSDAELQGCPWRVVYDPYYTPFLAGRASIGKPNPTPFQVQRRVWGMWVVGSEYPACSNLETAKRWIKRQLFDATKHRRVITF